MKIEICLKTFVMSIVFLFLSGALATGVIQELINFDSVDGEIFMFMLCSGLGLVCLFTSIKIKK